MGKKDQIRKGAIKVVAQEGYYNTTVQMIAQQAGVAVGTVYNYFDNKGEVLNYIFEVELKKRIRLLEELKEEELSLKEKLTTFLHYHLEELKTNPDTTSVLLQESKLPSKHSQQAITEFMAQLPALFAEMIEQAKEQEEIREVNSDLIANVIFNSIQGTVTKVANKPEYDFPQAKKELLNFFWLGLEK